MRCLVILAAVVALPFLVYAGFGIGDFLFGPTRWYMSAVTILLLGRLGISIFESRSGN